jgi:hypothetical protein
LVLATHAERIVILGGAMATLKAVSSALPPVVLAQVSPPQPDATAVVPNGAPEPS